MAIKERRTKILLLLYLLSLGEFSPVIVDERVQKIFDLTFNQKTKGTISGMMKEGLIEKYSSVIASEAKQSQLKEIATLTSSPRNDNSYSLTKKGFYRLCLEFPFFRYLIDQWDGKWRVLSYEIPEKKRDLRDKLRRKVACWGLGPWHRSFWLTPHPIIEDLKNLIAQKEEEKYVQAFEADHVFGDRNILIEKVWAKAQLEKKYREMFKKWHDILALDGDKVDKLQKVVNEYITLLRLDPGLPKELLTTSWIGFEAYNIFKEIKGILLT